MNQQQPQLVYPPTEKQLEEFNRICESLKPKTLFDMLDKCLCDIAIEKKNKLFLIKDKIIRFSMMKEVKLDKFNFSQLGLIYFDEDRYVIRDNGDVYDLLNNRIIASSPNVQGYKTVNLKENNTNRRVTCYVHHLVYNFFISDDFAMNRFSPKYSDKQIDHINQDRLDNRDSNIRLITKLENLGNRKKRCKAIDSTNPKVILKNLLKKLREYPNGIDKEQLEEILKKY